MPYEEFLIGIVGLNSIRAGIAETPEESSHTSVKQRVEDLSPKDVKNKTQVSTQDVHSAAQSEPHESGKGAMLNLHIESIFQNTQYEHYKKEIDKLYNS